MGAESGDDVTVSSCMWEPSYPGTAKVPSTHLVLWALSIYGVTVSYILLPHHITFPL